MRLISSFRSQSDGERGFAVRVVGVDESNNNQLLIIIIVEKIFR